jgi:hypothetical protein
MMKGKKEKRRKRGEDAYPLKISHFNARTKTSKRPNKKKSMTISETKTYLEWTSD